MKKLLFILLSISTFAQNDLSSLKGKKIYFFGDSITFGSTSYPSIVSNYFGAISVNRAVSGTTMTINMTSLVIPIYNKQTDGLLFIAFLTNDVRLNISIDEFEKAIDIVVLKAFSAGWTIDNIKFNIKYFTTEKGLNNNGLGNGLLKYNLFANLLKSKLDGYDIQYFDHWDVLEAVPNAVSYLDAIQIHPNSAMHKIIADNIMKTLYIQKSLSTDSFDKKDVITDLEYFNLLGQKIKEPKGITIVRGKNNGVLFTKKIIYND